MTEVYWQGRTPCVHFNEVSVKVLAPAKFGIFGRNMKKLY